jgi:hypothetical protein
MNIMFLFLSSQISYSLPPTALEICLAKNESNEDIDDTNDTGI